MDAYNGVEEQIRLFLNSAPDGDLGHPLDRKLGAPTGNLTPAPRSTSSQSALCAEWAIPDSSACIDRTKIKQHRELLSTDRCLLCDFAVILRTT
jgi:hypothetical protein